MFLSKRLPDRAYTFNPAAKKTGPWGNLPGQNGFATAYLMMRFIIVP
jgi:hypothetical protein